MRSVGARGDRWLGLRLTSSPEAVASSNATRLSVPATITCSSELERLRGHLKSSGTDLLQLRHSAACLASPKRPLATLKMAFDDRPSDLYGEENLASYSRESFTTVATNAGGAIGYKLRPVLQAQLSSGQGFTDLRSLGHALPDSATAVGPWDSISATGGSGRRVGLVQQAELIRATLEMDSSLSVPAILREAALLVGTEPEGPLLVQVCRAHCARPLLSHPSTRAHYARLCTSRSARLCTPPHPSSGGTAARLPRPRQRSLDAPADAGATAGAARVQRGCGGCGGRRGGGCGEHHAPPISLRPLAWARARIGEFDAPLRIGVHERSRRGGGGGADPNSGPGPGSLHNPDPDH